MLSTIDTRRDRIQRLIDELLLDCLPTPNLSGKWLEWRPYGPVTIPAKVEAPVKAA